MAGSSKYYNTHESQMPFKTFCSKRSAQWLNSPKVDPKI